MKRFSILLLLAGLVVGCGDDGWPDPGAIPDDFGVEYSWYEGSVAPPYHYEFDIDLARDGTGTIRYRPDYGSDPEWAETFAVTEEDLEYVYSVMFDAGVFSRSWLEDPEPPVGGSVAGMTVTAAGETHEIPLDLAAASDREAMVVVYGAIEELVPLDVWRDMEERRGDFMDGYGSE